uniref:DUF4220 domain-containing protein n=1 Tax=Oryza glumipatula TaxID=40148 RepID=A0A0D9ZGQ6_9ORYZ
MFPAAWLMFAVGAAKNAERVWALYQGNLSTIRKAVDSGFGRRQEEHPIVEINGDGSPQDLLLYAHSQFKVCKVILVDSSSELVDVDTSKLGDTVFSIKWEWEKRWTVFQMEVSLLYDILYTKAGVIHTWHGYFLRVFSPLAAAAALLLFHLSASASTTMDSHSAAVRVDVGITYTLLIGAILLDIVSLVSAAGSGWAYAFLVSEPRRQRHGWLYHEAVCNGRWHQLHAGLEYLSHLVNAHDRRKWSGAINCPRQQSKKKYTGPTVVIPPDVMKLVFNELERIILMKEEIDEIKIKSGVSRYGHDVKPSGETMQSGSEPAHLTKAEKGQHAVAELSDRDRMYLERFICHEISIIIWHIGTDVYLRTCEGSKKQDTVVRAIKLLSNYLMFLMVEHPTMVPGIDLRNYYRRTYKTLSDHAGNANGDPDKLAEILAQKGSESGL